jgi:hypothetical protein
MTQEEHDREYRVVDQMISMHAYITQAKKSQALWLSVGLLFGSAITCGFTFADDATIRLLGIGPGRERLVVGFASLFLFALSIVELRVDWGGIARAHEDASKRLSLLKAKYRKAQASQLADKQLLWLELSKEYTDTLASVAEIPEKSFAKLKAHHRYKVELSRMIDKRAGVPVWLLALYLRAKAIRNFARDKQSISE